MDGNGAIKKLVIEIPYSKIPKELRNEAESGRFSFTDFVGEELKIGCGNVKVYIVDGKGGSLK